MWLVWLVLATGQTARVVATGSLMSGDGVYHFAHLHSIVVDRDLDPVNDSLFLRDRTKQLKQATGGRSPSRTSAPISAIATLTCSGTASALVLNSVI